ncbi:MAG: alkaline phosphatase family protein [Oscillospiraceae bacterium]|nr:alkaline phosphatase family protein [Oscillospiraceae bacterium]
MKRVVSLLLAAALLLSLTACKGAVSAFSPEGDLEGYTFAAFRAGEAFDLALYFDKYIETRAQAFDLLLIAADGFAARIAGDDLTGCTLVFNRAHEWEFRSELHPPSANVRNLAAMVVVSTSDDPRAVHFIQGDKVRGITAGQLRLLDTQCALREEGTSRSNGRSVTVYTTQRRVPLADILPEGGSFCAMGFSGETMFFRGPEDSILVCERGALDLHLADGRILRDIAGVMADPPGFLITETYHDALRALEQGRRVMIIELDGMGFDMLPYAPHLASLSPRRALACYPPISPVGLAAMLTGETPDVHGIQGRENRALSCEDLFAAAEQLGKTCAYIEGGHTLINTSMRPDLALDDANAFTLAKDALESAPDLLFVHFHGIDEAAHAFGPHAGDTRQVVAELDGCVRSLLEGFDGRVIITADHGLHKTEGGGNHGEFLPEDMVVPYVVAG